MFERTDDYVVPADVRDDAGLSMRERQAFHKMRKALEAADELFKYALPKFNWGASFLDGKAIDLLNTVPTQVAAALQPET